MKINKIKYLGVCGATLLIIAPLTNSAVTLVGQPIQTQAVHADDIDSEYQTDLRSEFKSSVSFTQAQIKDLIDSGKFAFSKNIEDGKVTYEAGEFVTSGSNATDSLNEKLIEPYLKLFLIDNAKVKHLNKGYQVKMNITSGGLTFPSREVAIDRIKNLSAGSKLKVKLTAIDSSDKIKATQEITVNITSNPTTKIKLATPEEVSVNENSSTSGVEGDAYRAIKDSNGREAFTENDLGTVFYYGVDLKGEFQTLTSFDSAKVFNQLIPIKYTNVVAAKYDPSSFVFLNGSKRIKTSPDNPGPTSIAYVVRKIKVGEPTYPVFKYTSKYQGISSTIDISNDGNLIPGPADATKLTYKYNDSTSFDKLKEYLKGDFQTGSQGAGKLKAYKENDGDKLDIEFEMPDVKPASSPQFVVATAINKDNGAVSKIKIPIVVTDIPDPDKAPTVTKFPSSDVIIDSNQVSKYDLYSGVEATFSGTDGKSYPLKKENIKITVKDSKDNAVSISSDGILQIKKAETYKAHYVFSNPSAPSKVTTKDLNIKVNAYDLKAPTVTGFVDDAIYTLSNDKQKEINPLAPILGMDKVEAKFVSMDGKTYKIRPSQIKFDIKDEYGRTVELNSNKCIPMDKLGTYTIDYTWLNPEDESKKTTKSLTLIINSVKSDPIEAKYSNNEAANPTIDTSTSSFNVLANVSFTVKCKDPNSSTPDTTQTITIPNNCITIKVTKNGIDVPLTNYSFKPSEGTYNISYKVVNPKDNAVSLNYTRVLTVKSSGTTPTPKPTPTTPSIQDANGVVWIDYVPGYGVNVWKNYNTSGGYEINPDGSVRKLMTGTAWRYHAIATYSDGSTWYKVGRNQWIQGQYASTSPVNVPSSWTVTDRIGVGDVSYVPGYGINVWTSADQNNWTKKITHGTAWKYFKVATKDGKTMYNLGGNQWVDGNYFLPRY